VGPVRVSGRTAVAVIGALVWLLPLVIATGGEGLVALITNVLMVAILVVVGSATRSITVRRVASMFFYGGFMVIGIMLVALVFDPTGPNAETVIPFFEELLKLVPVAAVLWAGRNGRTWSLGATDVLLMAAACGAGFAVLEDAHIRENAGWAGSLPLLPSTEVRLGGGVILGHALWTALAGAGLGIALHYRSRPAIAIPAALGTFVVALLDHIGLNSGSEVLGTLTMDGYLSLVLFLAGLGACLALDLGVLRGLKRRPAELSSPEMGRDLAGLRGRWGFELDKRALLYAAHQHARARESARDRPRAVTIAHADAVLAWHRPQGLAS
jgi:RsiW-degrading membrane proteinase PrsW (M82 family)